MRLFLAVVLIHWCEHAAQVWQLYAWNTPMHKAGGVLGTWYPWLAHSETLHYGFALVMLLGLYLLRDQFSGRARFWWDWALAIQVVHHAEHALLLAQATTGHNLFGYPLPISMLQLVGLTTGHESLLTMQHFGPCDCPGAPPGTVHVWTPWLFVARRPETHLLYNTLVTLPMVIAMLRKYMLPPGEYAVHVFVPALRTRLEKGGDQPCVAVRPKKAGFKKMYLVNEARILGPSALVERFDDPLPGTNGRGVAILMTRAPISVRCPESPVLVEAEGGT